MATKHPDRRGYVRASSRFKAQPQIDALKAAGVRVIYEEGKGASIDDAIRALRPGGVLVVDGLHRLGDTRAELLDVLEEIAERRAVIEDAHSGEQVTARAAALVVDALRVIAGEARIPSSAEARRRGAKGGRPKLEKMPAREAVKIWRDWANYPTPEDALAAMPGWSKRSAYRPTSEGGLGPRGAPAGRPRKST